MDGRSRRWVTDSGQQWTHNANIKTGEKIKEGEARIVTRRVIRRKRFGGTIEGRREMVL